jgi:hypothetical protein
VAKGDFVFQKIQRIIHKLQLINSIIKNKASAFALSIFSRYRLVHATGFLLLLNISTYKKAHIRDGREINILFLPKAGFNEDMVACFGETPEYSLYSLDRSLIKSICYSFLPDEIDNFNYRSEELIVISLKRELRSFWVQVFQVILKRRRIDALMSGNFSYAAEQELIGAFNEMGIPAIALHKECLNTPRLEDFYIDIYKHGKNPFQGAKILVYNESERNIQLAGGISTPENIIITGMPRLDNIHMLRQRQGAVKKSSHNGKPLVLFFTFNAKTGLPFLEGMGEYKKKVWFERLGYDVGTLSLSKFVRSVHHAMVDLSTNHPEIEIIIKTKGNARTFRNFENIFGKDPIFPKNLRLVHGGDPFDLIAHSTVVCGFNSTALLESIALNKPVVVPKFEEDLEEKIIPYIIDLRDAVQYASSPEDLIEKLLKECEETDGIENSPELSAVQIAVLEEFTGNADGKAGLRVRKVVADAVNESRKGSQN